MKEAAIFVLVIFALAQAWTVWYFFVYKMKKSDEEYEEKMRKIYGKKM